MVDGGDRYAAGSTSTATGGPSRDDPGSTMDDRGDPRYVSIQVILERGDGAEPRGTL
jgi:hypothetical protein